MFLFRRRKQQSAKENISHLVGKPRASAAKALLGKKVQYVALKAGEQPPSSSSSIYIICYDSVTDIVTSAT